MDITSPGASGMPSNPTSPPCASKAMRSPETVPGRFQCPECQKSFGRIEHLNRHSQSHSRDRPRKCPRCQKGFYRLDALIRHEKIHENSEDPPSVNGSRACTACSRGRRKCSKELPCSACRQRSIECIFPTLSKASAGSKSTEPSGIEQCRSNGEEMNVRSDNSSWSNEINTTREGNPDPSVTTGNAQVSIGMDPANHGLDKTSAGHASSNTTGSGINDINTTIHQSLWSTNAIPATYEENWHENNLSSINWLSEDWNPALDLSHPMSLTHPGPWHPNFGVSDSTSSIHPDHPSPYSRLLHNDFGGRTPHTTDSPRHWVQTGTPINSHGSEHASIPQSQPSIGRLYVDGDGARLPHVRKGLYQHNDSSVQELDGGDPSNFSNRDGFWFPDFPNAECFTDATSTTEALICQESYDSIRESFQSTCVASNYFSPYHTSNFPAIGLLAGFIQLYFLHFQQVFPFIHTASFSGQSAHWLLILAMGAIGSLYQPGDANDIAQCSVALLEFLRRALLLFEEKHDGHDTLLVSQVKLLSSIGAMYCGITLLSEKAKSNNCDLVRFCIKEWLHPEQNIRSGSQTSVDQYSVKNKWENWYEAESRRRTGYCIWLLDCMWAFHFQTRPLLSLEDASVSVPCQEVLWEAQSASSWEQLYSVATMSLSLHSVMKRAYLEKHIQSSMGEFGRILCVHALFRRTWDVEAYFQKPLVAWTPTANRQDIETIEASSVHWLPGISTVSKWRNSACDVLDILHWHANSVIGASSGMEHPTVLHLHLARVVLLTPFREINQLVYLLVDGNESTTRSQDIVRLRKNVQLWVLDDQYKARLAMIHAGVLFWHVRRYSVDAFYEPSSVFLATLALWAYGSFAPNTPVDDPDGDDSSFPDSMQLDRPADDELVQLFVKRGSLMKAKVTGVGNLCQAKGPRRILLEGKKLLSGLRKWGIKKTLIETLNALIEQD